MKLRNEWLRLLLLIVLVAGLWCRFYHRQSRGDWEVPILYNGDALQVLSWTKASMEREFLPFGSKINKSLGAPFTANWNDYPLSEDLLIWVNGRFARLLGLAAAVNFSFLSACVLAAASFYLVGRYCRWRWEFCAMGGVIFALSHYVFGRSIAHLTLSHYWHIPLYLLVCWWVGSAKGLTFQDRQYPWAAGIAAVTGFLSVYYANFFLQLLFLALLVQVVRRRPWPQILAPLSIAGICLAAFLLCNLDTLLYAFWHGVNRGAVVRSFFELDYYALHPVEFFIPEAHRWKLIQEWGWKYIVAMLPVRHQAEATYLGIVGCAGFVLMLCSTALNLMKRKSHPTLAPPWQAIAMISYGMAGGLNVALGLTGFILFRGGNRVSIVILALSLFFLVRTLSKLTRAWPRAARLALSFGLAILAVADQIPTRVSAKDIQKIRSEYVSDRNFVEEIEGQLPRGSMIFQLPTVQYPESPAIQRMQDYESFRPYLFSSGLRFSHGTCKGRASDSWTRDLEGLPPDEMIAVLESYGFAAICLNQRGYIDGGTGLLAQFQKAGRGEILSRSPSELVCIRLQPSNHPVVPPLTDLSDNWNRIEINQQGLWFAWSKGNASVTIENRNRESITRRATFDLRTISPRKVEVNIAGQVLWSVQLEKEGSAMASDLTLTLPPGKTELRLITDTPADMAGTPDQRSFAFALVNFRLK